MGAHCTGGHSRAATTQLRGRVEDTSFVDPLPISRYSLATEGEVMLKLALVLAIAVAQVGCYYEAGDRYKPSELPADVRERFERDKRDFLKIEDIKVGDGPVASWNRQLSFHMEVRYLDGTLVYRGPTYAIVGFYGMPEGGITDQRHLSTLQSGIRLGLNGMAVGGLRRITIDRKLVCVDLPDDVDFRAQCNLIGYARHHTVKKENLIVEVALKEACVPVKLEANIWYIGVNMDIWCRSEDTPRLDPTLSIWHFY